MPRFYTQVPTGARNAGLTASALRLYLYLDERAGKRGAWYDTRTALAAAIHCSNKTVTRATAELRRAGLIQTEQRPDQVLAFYVIHRQERLHPGTEMSPPRDTNVPADSNNHKEQPQRTTTGAARNHGQFEHLIGRD